MIIQYEPGDIVNVEDNIDAGEFAAETVTLLDKFTKTLWKVQRGSSIGLVEEIYLEP